MAKIMLFVSPNCPHCPKAAAVAMRVLPYYKKYGLRYEKLRVRTERGKTLAARYRINAFPTLLLFNNDDILKFRISGVPGEETLKAKIERVLGLRESLFERLFK